MTLAVAVTHSGEVPVSAIMMNQLAGGTIPGPVFGPARSIDPGPEIEEFQAYEGIGPQGGGQLTGRFAMV